MPTLDPPPTDSLLSEMLRRHGEGHYHAALDLARRGLIFAPSDPRFHTARAGLLGEMSQTLAAAGASLRAARAAPANLELAVNCGALLYAAGEGREALSHMRRAVDLAPGSLGVWGALAATLWQSGRPLEAENLYTRMLSIDPASAENWTHLAAVRLDLKDLLQARQALAKALALDPAAPAALYHLGLTEQTQRQPEAARRHYERSLALTPSSDAALNNLGTLLIGEGEASRALALFERALANRPGDPSLMNNLGSALRMMGEDALALRCYRTAIAASPGNPEILANHAMILRDDGLTRAATDGMDRARRMEPSNPDYAARSAFCLPKIFPSSEAIAEWRSRYETGVGALERLPGDLGAPSERINPQLFDLAYHDQDDRPLAERLAGMFRRKCRQLSYVAPHIATWQRPRGRRLRVGILCDYLSDHTIGRLWRGYIRHLDPARFDLILFRTPLARRDWFAASLAEQARLIDLPSGLDRQQAAIGAAELDVLLFPEVGMSPAVYYLAYARLAPVQAASWGHPNTTGLETIDYFLSSDLIEPPGAEAYYSERLVRFSRLPCCYEAPELPEPPSRAALGLPGKGVLYGCPQSLFKLHPDFDESLADIARGDPDGHIVLLEGARPSWSHLLRQRWARHQPILLERVSFVPRLPLRDFLALMRSFDILLDPIHFGSGNTLYEAMAAGTPIVTWPGRFMRGRIVAGAYRQMGIADTAIAPALRQYAETALSLGADPTTRKTITETLMARRGALFDDRQAVEELGNFLISAVEDAAVSRFV